MTYQEATRKLDSINRAKIGNNTWLEREPGKRNVHIVLHNTRIITLHQDGSYTMRTGGWRSHTTKDRLNGYLGTGASISIFQKNHEWFVASDVLPEVRKFHEGMKVRAGRFL